MPVAPVPHEAASLVWGDSIVNRVAVLVTLILFLIELTDLIRLFPQLLRCVSRWKGNLELEHSVSMARTRNTVALVTSLVLVLVADRWMLPYSGLRARIPETWRVLFLAAAVGGYVLLRWLFYLATPFRSRINEFASCLRHSMYNYQILLSSLMLVTVLPLVAFGVPDASIRIVLLVETGLFTALYLIRSRQIFASRCSILATILYLCALEILPLGILSFVCII